MRIKPETRLDSEKENKIGKIRRLNIHKLLKNILNYINEEEKYFLNLKETGETGKNWKQENRAQHNRESIYLVTWRRYKSVVIKNVNRNK